MAERKTIQINVASVIQTSKAVANLLGKLEVESSSILKRNLTTGVLRSGAMIEDAGLGSVLTFLDTPEFQRATEQEKQRLIFSAMALRLNAQIDSVPPAKPEAREQQPAAEEVSAAEDDVIETDSNTETINKPVIPVSNRFSKKFTGA